MKISLEITNLYVEDGDEVQVIKEGVEVERPSEDEVAWRGDLEEWAFDTLFPLTGTGRPEGDAAYFVKVTACPDMPDLVGKEFEWGT